MGESRIPSAGSRTLAVLSVLLLLAISSPAARAQDNNAKGELSPKTSSLIQQLQAGDPDHKYRAATALMQMKPIPPEAIAAIQFPINNDPSVRKALAEVDAQAVPSLTAAMHSPDPKVRLGAANILGAMARQRPVLWRDLLDALGSDDEQVRRVASIQFWNTNEADQRVLIPVIREALKAKDPTAILAVMWSIPNSGPMRSALEPEYVMLLKNSDPRVRETAANFLMSVSPRPKDAVPSLTVALKDPVASVRQAAAFTLAQIDPHDRDVVPVLIEALAPGGNIERSGIVNALGTMGSAAQEAIPTLEHLLTADENLDVRVAVADQLANIAGKKAAAVPLANALINDKAVEVRKVALKSINDLGPDGAPAIPALMQTLHDPEADVRQAAIDDLANLKALVVPALIAALQNPDLDIREEAIQALAQNNPLPAAAVPALTTATLKDKSLAVRSDAARVLQAANIDAGDKAIAQLEKQYVPALQPAKTDDPKRRYSKEEIIATVPPDADHAYPLRLASLLSIDANRVPPAYSEILVTLHSGIERPDRLAIWKKVGVNQYRLLQVVEADEDADEKISPPTLFTPKGLPPGEDVQFLEFAKYTRRFADDTLLVVDPDEDELRPVEIESAETWYAPKLQPGEEFSQFSENNFEDNKEPGFKLTLRKKKDPDCCPTAGIVTGTYKIIKDRQPSNRPGKEFDDTWKFVPAKATRDPMPPP